MRISTMFLVPFSVMAFAQPPGNQPTPVVPVFHPTGSLPSYEVATIKKADQNATGQMMATPIGGPRMISGPHGETIKSYIQSAYSPSVFSEAQVIGGPAWIASDSYVIQGKVPDELRTAMNKMTLQQQGDQNHMMEQSLLADRFQLKVHFEVREMPIYELTAAKGGLKVKEVPAPAPFVPGGPPPPFPGPGVKLPPGMILMMRKDRVTTMRASATTMASLINILRRSLDNPEMPVVDMTGFSANFDLEDIEFADRDAGSDADAPSLVAALQDKLGVRLTPTKGLVEVVVIDSIERPSEN